MKRLQDLFRELFQLDLADLDFGLHRLFHLKRVEIEAFLNEQLPRRVREAFQSVAGQEARDIQTEVSTLAAASEREAEGLHLEPSTFSFVCERMIPYYSVRLPSSAKELIEKRRIRMAGFLLTKTRMNDIPDAGDRSWSDLEKEYPLLRQEGSYVQKLFDSVRDK